MPPSVPPQNPYPPQNGYPRQTQPSQPGKKGNGLIIAIIVAGLLLVGGGVTAFLLLRNKNTAPVGGEQPSALLEKPDTTDADKKEAGPNDAENTLTEDNGIGEPTGKGIDETSIDATEASDVDDPEVAQVKQRLQRFQYDAYYNARYDFTLQVPDFMAPGPEAQNGDGRKFFFNGITLSAFASHNALETDVDGQMDFQDPDRKARRQRVGGNAFTLKGRGDDGQLYELKSVLKDEVWYTARIDYPEKFKSVIAPLSQIVAHFEP